MNDANDKENSPNLFPDMPILERMDQEEMEEPQFPLESQVILYYD